MAKFASRVSPVFSSSEVVSAEFMNTNSSDVVINSPVRPKQAAQPQTLLKFCANEQANEHGRAHQQHGLVKRHCAEEFCELDECT